MIRKYGGKELARVLYYYGLIDSIPSSQMNIMCPFHNDINPSMMVDIADGSFYCFGCGVSGGAYEFVSFAQPELTDLQKAILLEQILNSSEVKKLSVRHVKKKDRTGGKQALAEADDYYYGLKPTNWMHITTPEEKVVFEYMTERGFNSYALNVGECRASYSKYYPVIFPILDNGKFRGYVCRTNDKRVAQFAKYKYNEGFNKRDTLCGVYHENSVVWLCEGFFDYLSLRTRGKIENVCAVLGWHISDRQVEKLKAKGVQLVVSALDSDSAGRKGTEYLKKFFDVIEMPYPMGVKDPGDMTREQFRVARRKVERKVRRYERNKSCD